MTDSSINSIGFLLAFFSALYISHLIGPGGHFTYYIGLFLLGLVVFGVEQRIVDYIIERRKQIGN